MLYLKATNMAWTRTRENFNKRESVKHLARNVSSTAQQSSAVPSSFVVLTKLFILSEPQFLHLKK